MNLKIVDGTILGVFNPQVEEIIIPQRIVHSIGSNAFHNCKSLRTVIFQGPSGVKNIEDGAFSGCESLCMIRLPHSIEIISDNAFRGCVKLTTIEFPINLIYLGSSVFNACLALETIELPKTLKLIEKTALINCPHIKRLRISRTTRVLGGNELTRPAGCRVSYYS
jgi:hypothetical protein